MTTSVDEIIATATELHRLVDKLTARYGPASPQVQAVRQFAGTALPRAARHTVTIAMR